MYNVRLARTINVLHSSIMKYYFQFNYYLYLLIVIAIAENIMGELKLTTRYVRTQTVHIHPVDL